MVARKIHLQATWTLGHMGKASCILVGKTWSALFQDVDNNVCSAMGRNMSWLYNEGACFASRPCLTLCSNETRLERRAFHRDGRCDHEETNHTCKHCLGHPSDSSVSLVSSFSTSSYTSSISTVRVRASLWRLIYRGFWAPLQASRTWSTTIGTLSGGHPSSSLSLASWRLCLGFSSNGSLVRWPLALAFLSGGLSVRTSCSSMFQMAPNLIPSRTLSRRLTAAGHLKHYAPGQGCGGA